MTYNILHEAVRTLMPPWTVRGPLVAGVIRSAQADVVCLQEVSPRQFHDLARDLPEYQFFSGRLSGGTRLPRWAMPAAGLLKFFLGDFYGRGENCPILVRSGFGMPVGSGSFPLGRGIGRGSTPFRGSAGRSPAPHVVNWVRIALPDGRTLDVFNTHLGHMPWTARSTAETLLRIAGEQWDGGPQILAGDFNTMPFSTLVRSLTKSDMPGVPAFEDAFAHARARTGGGVTFHWGFGLPGPRIDYVLVRPPCGVDSVIVTGKRVGRTLPSDHYAVVVDLRLTGS